ncbi:uncharacterized protein [Salvelinus alpinus]|uniref:uncharacterized protein isoform X5 n=1 Tax=Salvelinus alpinus TaxID=8036 RepID=UPI0039FC6FBF
MNLYLNTGFFHGPDGPSGEQMIPAWSLGVLLLGYVFGFPVPFNSTQRQYEYETLPQLNDTVRNTTQPFMSNDTESNETEIPFPFQIILPMENMSPLLDYDHAIPPEELMQSQNETDSNSTLTTYNAPPSLVNKRERQPSVAGTRVQAGQPETHMATARDERKSSGGR